MPNGYLVTLGDFSLDAGDIITDPIVAFTTATNLGAGQWTWSGTFGGTTYTDELEPGVYYEATDGNVYFVPDYGPVDTITSADVTSAPAYSSNDGIVTGTGSADLIDASFTDADGDQVSTGDDTVNAGAGDDTIIGGAGADTIDGGAGSDTASYAGSASGVSVNLASGTNTGGDAEGDVLSDIENVTGSSFDDTLTGDTANNVLDGADGADTIDGGDGNDTILGGAGNDTLVGNAGNDSIYGGDGDDIIGEITATEAAVLDWVTGSSNGTFAVSGGTLTTNVTTTTSTNGAGQTASIQSTGTPAAVGLWVNGLTDTVTTTMAFDTSVENLTFEIYDLDFQASGWDDAITITGIDADGNPVTINFSDLDGVHSVTGNTVNADGNDSSGVETTGAIDSVTVTIPGPLTGLTIVFDNGESWASSGNFGVGNMNFDIVDTIEESGDDTIDGGAGADLIDAGSGDDTIQLNDGFGNDTITGGETGETAGDTLDTSGLTSGVNVTFTSTDGEDGTATVGTDTASFEEIENVAYTDHADTIDASATTAGMTINAAGGNDFVTGGSGADTIDGGDGDDILAGGIGGDTVSGGAGDDTITVAQGDDVTGGDGDDTFNIVDLGEAGSGTINIIGGEGDETDGDTLNWADVADKDSLVITNADDAAGGLSGTFTMLDGTVVTFSEIENIVCFASGTNILTTRGLRKIEDLEVGDFVITRDNGLQPIRWIGKRTVPALNKFAPIRFAAGSLPNLDRPLLVSPQHRMLVSNHRSQLYLNQSEVLVTAKHMVNGTTITREVGGEVTYMHMLFDQHEIVYADGTASESFHPGDVGLDAISDAARSELFSLFPQLRTAPNQYGGTARLCLRKHEALMVA